MQAINCSKNFLKIVIRPLSVSSSVQNVALSSFQIKNFGLCFDIDGVITRGFIPFEESKKAFQLLRDEQHRLRFPTVFVTNGKALHSKKAQQLSSWVDVPITPDNLVLCQTPLTFYEEFKYKNCLFVGQGPVREIAQELGFKKVFLIEDISNAYPLLDTISFHKKEKVHNVEDYVERDFPKIEAVIILGEPDSWETPLQLIIDLLLTNGHPRKGVARLDHQSIPIIACNKDFQYMHRSHLPRFGNGTFLLCLEKIFKKLVNVEIDYRALVGKPSETTMRFAEHKLTQLAKSMNLGSPLHTMYMIGDNINSDITAANLYQRYVRMTSRASFPTSRQLPPASPVEAQTVRDVHSVLVRTGVYSDDQRTEVDHSHKDFRFEDMRALATPSVVVDNVLHAVEYILERELGGK